MIRVVLIDDHHSFRQTLAIALERESDIHVVGQADTLAATRRMIQGLQDTFDVALLDLRLPDGNGKDLIEDLQNANPLAPILVLTALFEQVNHAQAVEAGAAGSLYKGASLNEVLDTIRQLSRGEHIMSPEELITMVRLAVRHRNQDRDVKAAFAQLTPREREVLQALADGLNDKDIALNFASYRVPYGRTLQVY